MTLRPLTSSLSSPGFKETTGRFRRHGAVRWWLVLVLLVPVFASCLKAATEYEVKAAFLFNFAKFIEWPLEVLKPGNQPMVIGVLGDSPLGQSLAAVVDKQTVKGHRIEVRHYSTADDVSSCQILFINSAEKKRVKNALQQAQSASILTVGEDPEFAAEGGMINFVLVDKTVRFEINTKAVAAAKLKVSSKLLAVAHKVES
jgi:hypothetical protein